MFDPQKIKQDFPIFSNHSGLLYLDNAATTHKPQAVITAISDYYQTNNANVGRGVYDLAEASSQSLNQARQTIANFFGAQAEELILTGNSTAAINGVAYGWADHHLQPEDIILTSILEHHSNLVVWQQVAKRTRAKLVFTGLKPTGQISIEQLQTQLKKYQPQLLALSYVSNTTGAVLDLGQVTQLVKEHSPSTKILIDGAQAVGRIPINFSKLNIDFFAFSGHKMLGPMGSGGLLVKKELLNSGEMQPWLFGGGMIEQVKLQQTEFNHDLNQRFMAGTPDVAGAVGLAAACQYLNKLGIEKVLAHDQHLLRYALMRLSQLKKDIKLVDPTQMVTNKTQLQRVGSVAFISHFAQAHDVAQALNQEKVAVRSGYHCAQPLHEQQQWPPTVRLSFSVYNSKSDIDFLLLALNKIKKMFL